MWYSLWDFQFEKKELMKNPKHYEIGITNSNFSTQRFWIWIVYGLA